jgi:ABC-type polysaccharide/polyol phosphate transport system ATPase subunit
MGRIELNKASLTFRVRERPGRVSLKELVVRRLLGQSSCPVVKVRALRDLTFSLRGGERVGILGHNGAGKSTLLKLLAGVYAPTRGTRWVEGRISSLFDISLGFESEASGWENIFYRGYLQGETPKSMAAKAGSIAEFSELGDYLRLPVRYYSAGMMVRLAFSIATAIEPEILLIDEVLNVGDAAFQSKARLRMKEMMGKADLIVLVSHDLDTLSRVCQRGIWMEQGQIRLEGPMDEVVDCYRRSVNEPGPATSPPVGGLLETENSKVAAAASSSE